MQFQPTDISSIVPSSESSAPRQPTTQDGCPLPTPGSLRGCSQSRSRSLSPSSIAGDLGLSTLGVGADVLDDTLRKLSVQEGHAKPPGERISDYENAVTPIGQRNSLLRVVKQYGSPQSGASLSDCPNELLTQILSHLHPDSHGAVALVSKRFYTLMTEPHAWRMAFLRYFPGTEALVKSSSKELADTRGRKDIVRVRSEFRLFTRLTSAASWRSEYLLRTRLLRSVARGRPAAALGSIGGATRSNATKKSSAVLTYNSKLPWMISNVHAVFDSTKKGPRAIVGTADLCVSTISDPSTGKVEKSGLDDPFSFAQLDEIDPNLQPFGLGDGPAAVYNVMDVSQLYGMIGGEGFPGGRPYYRGAKEVRGRYLGDLDSSIIHMAPEVPKIPESAEAICSVWIAKSSGVPTVTENMIGMMTGSSLGIITAYAVGHDASGPRYKAGEMTARWVLSPGVPIISLKVDENYNYKRRTLERIWACAVNALGEVFVLSQTPTPPNEAVRKELDSTKAAWLAARTVYWDLIESTRRQARADKLDKNALRGAYSPRSPCDTMALGKEQVVAEAREIEKFLRYKPTHFRKVCEGWDMQRKVEVDFAEEIVIVCRCLQDQDTPPEILRHMHSKYFGNNKGHELALANAESPAPVPSTFSSCSESPTPASANTALSRSRVFEAGDWRTSKLSLKILGKADITSTAIDNSLCASQAPFEEPLNGDVQLLKDGSITPTSQRNTGEIPGRRARFFGIGTGHGQVILWNIRDKKDGIVEPICAIQTESPDITTLAISALYIVCGGSDGLVQAWDPLLSSLEPIRTLSSKSSGRAPRHMLNANPLLRQADYSTCSAIFLDPDATSLRGVLCFGTFVRYWTYSSAAQTVGRKRRPRHSEVHGRLAGRRQGHAVQGYIAAEEAELRTEKEHNIREDARLRSRFGVGMADLTEEESVLYAQIISEEAFLADEQLRRSASDTGSTADLGENISTSGSLDTVTPEPSLAGRSPFTGTSFAMASTTPTKNDDFEQQIQRALRLSLMDGASPMEGVSDMGQSPPTNSSTDFEFPVKFKPQKKKRSAPASRVSSSTHTSFTPREQALGQSWRPNEPPSTGEDNDEDLALALRLSLQEEQQHETQDVGLGIGADDFPPLESSGKGKGVARR